MSDTRLLTWVDNRVERLSAPYFLNFPLIFRAVHHFFFLKLPFSSKTLFLLLFDACSLLWRIKFLDFLTYLPANPKPASFPVHSFFLVCEFLASVFLQYLLVMDFACFWFFSVGASKPLVGFEPMWPFSWLSFSYFSIQWPFPWNPNFGGLEFWPSNIGTF